MGITVGDALKISCMEGAKVVAGFGGIGNIIKRVSVLECPEPWQPGNNSVGDFFITAFFSIKDDEKAQYEWIRLLIEGKCSGICIIDTYMSNVNDEIKVLAEQNNLPVIIISDQVLYADIITGIMDIIIKSKDDKINELKIDNLLNMNKNEHEVLEVAEDLNPAFKNNIISFYAKDEESANHYYEESQIEIKNMICLKIKYNGGLLFIISSDCKSKTKAIEAAKIYAKAIIDRNKTFKVGISCSHELKQLDICVREAFTAYNLGVKQKKNRITHYYNIGIYKMLIPFINKRELEMYRDEFLNPIIKYDAKYHLDLLKTLNAYIRNDGDLKKTAAEFFQHINTTRYRLEKIKELLNMEGLNYKFFEEVSTAIKIDKILPNSITHEWD